MWRKLERFLPIVFLLLLWIVFAHPYFFQGKVPYPSTYQVNHFQPWSLDSRNWGPVKNGAMPDIIDQIYPWRHFSIQQWKQGQVPWWNPNSFAGNPNIANVQSAAFNPLNLFFFVLPFIDAWSVIVLLQPIIAGAGMLLFLRSHNISRQGSLLGSIGFMFCGFITTWMAYGTLSLAIASLPLVLFFLRRMFVTKNALWGILASLTIAFSFFSGHFQTSLYLFVVAMFYAIFLMLQAKIRMSVLLIFFLALGIGFSLIQILPAVQFYGLSPRSAIYLFSGGIPVEYLITLIAPDFYGNPVTRNDWFGAYAEWSSFIGVIPFLFALFTILRKPAREVLFFQLLFFFSLLLSLNSPLLSLLGSLHIPVVSTSTPSRLIVIASFSLSVLSGFGHDIARQFLQKEGLKKILLPGFFLIVFISLIWAAIILLKLLSTDHMILAAKNFVLPVVLFSASLVSLFFAHVLKRKKQLAFVFLVFPIVFASFDSLRFAIKWMPFDPKSDVFPKMEVITRMQQMVGSGRVYGNLGAQVGTYYDIPLIEGYDPLYVDRYGEFIRYSESGSYMPSERSVVKLARNGKYTKRVLDLLGVTLIYHPVPDTNQTWAFPVWNDARYKLVYTDGLFSLYNNTTAIRRPMLYYDFKVIPEGKKLLGTFYSDDFDFRSVLLLEEDPGIKASTIESKSHVTLVKNDPTHLIASVSAKSQALLFLSDNYYPGWKAFVNGKQVKIYRADYTFRAVVVPAGKSTVVFQYTGLF